MVAEYEPIDENPQENPPTVRKSEFINEWCDKNTITLNKLYPTIIGETYIIDNELSTWKSTCLDFTDFKDRISDCDANTSFKSCFSNISKTSDVRISGVQPLEFTSDETGQSSEPSNGMNQRISVYENFSLPGSPKTITHMNYKTKTSLKKQKSKNTKSNTCPSSLISSDCSQELDRVLAVAQNKTNEWLCTSMGEEAGNTRRSSASSGVSSHYSGGSIVIANVHEEYKYEDKEEDVVLIERRLLVSPVV